jgi:predicted MFS family arabinose efflux permease
MELTQPSPKKVFTKYQVFIIGLLSVLQFTVILDFIVISPLGAQLLKELHIATSQFGLVVSVYAFSAGISGILAAGFADKFDRKKLLLFFYAGFIVGTLFCGVAPNYNFLLVARIVTGIFGGVMNSIIFTIVTDLFKQEVRGRVMGFVQMAFATSQVLGVPLGLYLTNIWGWHSPFLMIAGLSLAIAVAIFIYMRPINAHLLIKQDSNPFKHIVKTVSKPVYINAFIATTILIVGGFMLMPFSSAFTVNNMGISMNHLPLVYLVTGIFSMMMSPMLGKITDKVGKFKLFTVGTILGSIVVLIYSNSGITPLWGVIALNVFLSLAILTRMISSSTLMTMVPEPQERGAFMSISSSIQQIAGGIASICAGLIVFQNSSGKIEHFNILGYIVVFFMLVTIGMIYLIERFVIKKNMMIRAAQALQTEKSKPELSPEVVEINL